MIRRPHRYLLPLALLLILPGCRLSEPALKFFNQHVGPIFSVRLQFIDTLPPVPAPSASAEAELEGHRKISASFIKEAHSVVLEREVSKEEFDRWMNVLDQGGSLEGIHNGLTHGDEYRNKEKGIAPPDALRLYAQLMAALDIDGRAEGSAAIPEADKKKLISEYAQKAVNKSLYTLKREATLQAIKTMDTRKAYKDKWATWFSKFSVSTNARGVDFGSPERNKSDEQAQYQWALDASEDRVKWEVFNRIHRLFNGTGR